MSEFERAIIKIADAVSGMNDEKIKGLEDRISKLEKILNAKSDEISTNLSIEVGNAINIADNIRQKSTNKKEAKSFSEMQKAAKDLLDTMKDVGQRVGGEYSGYKDRNGRKIFIGDTLDFSVDGMDVYERLVGKLSIESGNLKLNGHMVKGIGYGDEKHSHVFMDDSLLIKRGDSK